MKSFNGFYIEVTPESAEVQKDVKKVPYTVTVIGEGKEALDKWKVHRIQVEAQYNKDMAPIRALRRQTAVAMVQMEIKAKEASKLEQKETHYLDHKNEIKRSAPYQQPLEEPKDKFSVSKWLSKVLEDAFFKY